ncbi:MAG: tRNA (adenosine(37)-N6)-threonylcarbamoyltransferase complex dimerization subunit type 1 TsaB [Planctomycetota bacterium]
MILAIETSHVQGEVALGEGEFPTVSALSPGLVHGRELQPKIAQVCEAAGTPPAALDLVAVSAGPGSYTGLRIGVATAKAIAWALGKPALAISTLEAIAQNVTEPGPFVVILDARRGACYCAEFQAREDADGRVHIERQSADRAVPFAELADRLAAATRLLGEGAVGLPGASAREILPAEWNLPRAAEVYRLARRRWRAVRDGQEPAPPEFGQPHLLVPFYLRPSQAEERSIDGVRPGRPA